MAITVQGSVQYVSPDDQQQPPSRPLCFVQWPLSYNDQHRTNRPTPNNKPRPDHSATYNGQYRTTISTTVSIFQRPTATAVLTTRLGVMALIVQQSAPHKSDDAKQQTTSRSLCYLQRSIPYNDQCHSTYGPMPSSKPRPSQPVR